MVLALILSGCKGSSVLGGVNIGPTIRAELTIVSTTTQDQRSTEFAYITDDLKQIEVEIASVENGAKTVTRALKDFLKEDETNLQGNKVKAEWTWVAVRPDVAKVKGLIAPYVTLNKLVNVLRPAGDKTQLDIGGWYIVKKGIFGI